MQLTSEQQNIVNTIQRDDIDFVAVSAVSGAGKTSLLTSIANTLQPTTGIYLAYNKAIATEASRKFPKSVTCMTTHSLAYRNTVKSFGLHVGTFNYRAIKEKLPYEDKCFIVDTIRNFCLSEHTSFTKFATSIALPTKFTPFCEKYLKLMQSGTIECSHDFYLKFYHLLLATKHIEHDTFDLLMLDEAGDLNPVTLEIFKLLPAHKKVMVGDENQNIYTFNGTINGFKAMEGVGVHLPMTQSFRVSAAIASRVEHFCRSYFNQNLVFTGVEPKSKSISTEAIITRTNGGLIEQMISAEDNKTPYNLVRTPLSIFDIPLMLLALKPNHYVSNPSYSYLQEDINTYHKDRTIQRSFKSFFSYISHKYANQIELTNAISIITRFGAERIIATYKTAKSHVGTKHPLTLCTAHSSKGLEFDKVTIADDANNAITKAIKAYSTIEPTPELLAEFRLYYVACTRARIQLDNAIHL